MSIKYRFSLFVIGVAVAVATALVACKPNVPLSGPVILEYAGVKEEQFRFRLANGSARAVRFSGWSFMFSDTLPEYFLTCGSDGTVTTEIGPPFHFPPARAPESIKVSSGEALQLAVPNLDFARPRGNGSHCYLELTMEGGASLKSNEFVP